MSLTPICAAIEFEHAAMAQDLLNHAVGRWLVPIDKGIPTTYPVSDLIGRDLRVTIPDAVAGCRLGCACNQHAAPKQPYVPSVTDWDLLPDAVAK